MFVSILILMVAAFLIVLWSKISENTSYSRELENRLNQLQNRLEVLSRSIQDLRSGLKPEATTELVKSQRIATPMAQSATEDVARRTEPAVPSPPLKSPVTEPEPAPPPVVPMPVAPPGSPSTQTIAPQLPRIEPQPQAKHRPGWELPKFDWESLVGVKLFSWIAGVALLLAVVFFLRYSINQGWLMPKVRMVIGIIVGLGLLAVCELKAARKYPTTANAMDASAIAILFSTFYAARALWGLMGAVPAFLLMVVVTGIAVLLSIRRDSAFIALLGLLGGFATPALLSTGENSPISLFTYLLLLNAGLAWVSAKKKWPVLMTLSLGFTVFYQWGWVIRFLTASQLPVALGIFLVFPVLAFVVATFGRTQAGKGWTALYGQTANITALLPLLFNLYLAAVPAYGQHYILLFTFLLLLDAGLFIIAAARGPEILHLVGGLSTLLIPAIWFWRSYSSDAWPSILILLVLLTFFYLFAPLIAQRFNRGFAGTGRWAVYTAPVVLFAFPALVAMEPACANPAPLFGVLLVLLLAISGYALIAETGPVYLVAAVFTLIAEAVWASLHLTPQRLAPGLVLFAVFGFLYVCVPVLARKWRKRLKPESAGSWILLLSIALLFFLATGSVAPDAIWGLAILLLLLNIGLIWHREPIIALGGMVLSWIVLASLWHSVSLDTILIPALVVMAGFALFVLAGNIWLQKKSPETAAPGSGTFLVLTGHLFLAVVAAQPALAIPPWPFLCVLLILDLAIGLSALYLREHEIHRAAMAGSALILMIWVVTARMSPWPGIAVMCAAALSLLSFLWIFLAKRTGNDAAPFSVTAAIMVFLAQILLILSAEQPGSPGAGYLLLAHTMFLVALMALAWFSRHLYVLIAVIPTTIAVTCWMVRHSDQEFWPQQLLFAVPIFLLFVAYPLLLGRRSGKSLEPYLAAVAASVPFFFQARHAMLQAGWGNVIGILPVVLALLMGFLVLRLLRIEPRNGRSLGRLAMVAGTALAFITVAIPLQLEKEWITIGWVLEGAALSWLYRKIHHKGLLYASAGLFAAVFARLALNPFVLTYAERSDIRIWNWYLYTYLLSVAAMIVGSRFLTKTEDRLLPGFIRLSRLVPAGAVILLFLLLNIEIADFYSVGPTITFNFSATLAQDLTYTLGWALFAVGLLAVGIVLHRTPARIASLGLLVGTSVKCFIHDLARLGELYRVMSFVGLGVCLALVALALQKFVFAERKKEHETTEPHGTEGLS